MSAEMMAPAQPRRTDVAFLVLWIMVGIFLAWRIDVTRPPEAPTCIGATCQVHQEDTR